ncbi:MAG TPA: MoaD/ThiS family protein [Streptosporangiaceae bacterium]|jgi:molybdopterin converting factor small subunit
MAIVTMRYWAAAKEAAGVAEEIVAADTLAAALSVIGGQPRENRGAAALSAVLARSSFLIDGHPVGRRAAESVALADGAVIEVLPPFAGG